MYEVMKKEMSAAVMFNKILSQRTCHSHSVLKAKAARCKNQIFMMKERSRVGLGYWTNSIRTLRVTSSWMLARLLVCVKTAKRYMISATVVAECTTCIYTSLGKFSWLFTVMFRLKLTRSFKAELESHYRFWPKKD